MSLILVVSLSIVLFAAVGGGRRRPPVEKPQLTPEERADAVKLMLESREKFFEEIEGLSDAQWNFKPGPFRWSVGEVAEHITLSESLILGAVKQALALEPDSEWETKTQGKEDLLKRLLLSRDRTAQAPEAIRPTRELSRAEVLERFRKSREKTLKFAKESDLALKEHVLDHPFPVFGSLNAYQWLIYIPLHHLRHDQQIAEIKADPNFPSR